MGGKIKRGWMDPSTTGSIERWDQCRTDLIGFTDITIDPGPTWAALATCRIIRSNAAFFSVCKASTYRFTTILTTETGGTFTLTVVGTASTKLFTVELG